MYKFILVDFIFFFCHLFLMYAKTKGSQKTHADMEQKKTMHKEYDENENPE